MLLFFLFVSFLLFFLDFKFDGGRNNPIFFNGVVLLFVSYSKNAAGKMLVVYKNPMM